jgi:hypothetical protein
MGEKKDRFKTLRVKKVKENKKELKPDYKDGTWHLLLLNQTSPYIQA